MLQTRERESRAAAPRRGPGRQSVLDALLMPPFAELSIARNLMSALTPAATEAPFVPSVELREKDGTYQVDVALPGFRKEDIDIDVSGNELTISGKYERRQEDAKTHYSEMQMASFVRTISLPAEIDTDRVTATFEDGVLRIVAPPTASLTHKKVPIGSTSTTGSASSGSGESGGSSSS